jgi:tRNA A37 threonylcarbamoyladenosine modification protein TsaB
MKSLNAAIDFSTGMLFLGVQDDSGKLVFESRLEMMGRDSSRMIPWIQRELEHNACGLSDIQCWTCGMGPGSFTGLRIVAALISGLTFDSSAKVRGVPSAIAIADEALGRFPKSKRIGILYDGRRKEALCYALTASENGLTVPDSSELPIITSEENSILNDFDLLAAMNTEKEALKQIIPDNIFDKIVFLDTFPLQRLISINNFPWTRDSLLHPVYLRPPVHVKPAKIRTNV